MGVDIREIRMLRANRGLRSGRCGEYWRTSHLAYRSRWSRIPGGGVPVAARVAQRLGCYNVAVVTGDRSWNPEAGYGAVAFDGTLGLNSLLACRPARSRSGWGSVTRERFADGRALPRAAVPELTGGRSSGGDGLRRACRWRWRRCARPGEPHRGRRPHRSPGAVRKVADKPIRSAPTSQRLGFAVARLPPLARHFRRRAAASGKLPLNDR
jgi:hypothetical protein